MARLKHVAGEALTIVRRRKGRGFAYVHADGRQVRDAETRSRISSLAIPPAWQEVVIAPDPRSHLQAKGVDAAGRTQYIYHPEWEQRRTRRKQRHLAALTAALPRVRAKVRRDLDAEAGEKALAIAIAATLIDRTAMRVGRERYLTRNGTRGAATLFTRDVKLEGDRVLLSFPAKSGKSATYVVEDAKLAAAMTRIKTLRGRRLLQFRGADGQVRSLRTGDICRYLQDVADAPVTAKDFRTLHASALAGEELARLDRGLSPTARRRQIGKVMQRIAGFLQNTPAIARASYVAPCLLHMFEEGTLEAAWLAAAKGTVPGGLRKRELCLAAIVAA